MRPISADGARLSSHHAQTSRVVKPQAAAVLQWL
jgi:hypothetical protein